jgi:hypothetical protein
MPEFYSNLQKKEAHSYKIMIGNCKNAPFQPKIKTVQKG